MNDILGTKLFSPIEAKELLGIGKNKIYELINAGEITYIEFAGKFKITEEAIRQFLERNTKRPTRPNLYTKDK